MWCYPKRAMDHTVPIVLLAFLSSLVGCANLLDLHEGAAVDEGSQSTAAGAGGGGGEAGQYGGGGAGGQGGDGGQGCSDIYSGDGAFEVTNSGDANLPSLSFGAGQSVAGHYSENTLLTEFRVGSTAAGCGLLLVVWLSGEPQVGVSYAFVDRAGFADTFGFLQGKNTYVTLLPTCSGEKLGFASKVGGGGAVTVTSVVGSVVTMQLSNVEVVGYSDGDVNGQGTLFINGSAHADCFYQD